MRRRWRYYREGDTKECPVPRRPTDRSKREGTRMKNRIQSDILLLEANMNEGLGSGEREQGVGVATCRNIGRGTAQSDAAQGNRSVQAGLEYQDEGTLLKAKAAEARMNEGLGSLASENVEIIAKGERGEARERRTRTVRYRSRAGQPISLSYGRTKHSKTPTSGENDEEQEGNSVALETVQDTCGEDV
ncbi:hypothetical protein EXIGLDRAFT_459763 [Exidia glandulosa HHB12029]|uniref:Uncharacterized protein n=1 Tax=Exidia glandulosa HHB12029 TaxID=1314781 RepID=A0A165K591_EXIGL|nr:hypothetical protein EXIGLDRAFT_459763 [Exidia glandulosa HHB12029]